MIEEMPFVIDYIEFDQKFSPRIFWLNCYHPFTVWKPRIVKFIIHLHMARKPHCGSAGVSFFLHSTLWALGMTSFVCRIGWKWFLSWVHELWDLYSKKNVEDAVRYFIPILIVWPLIYIDLIHLKIFYPTITVLA